MIEIRSEGTLVFEVTSRQKLVAATATALGFGVLVSAALEQWQITAVLASVLLTATLIVLLDVRRRAGQLMTSLPDQRAFRTAIDDLKSRSTHVDELTSGLARVETALRNQSVKLTTENRDVMSRLDDQASEVAAQIQLFAKVTPRAPMPPRQRWSLSATDLLNLFFLVERQRPTLVLELGGGTSTVWLSYALTSSGGGRLVSVDHLEEFAEHTRAAVESHGLANVADVRFAPLTPVQLGEKRTYHWYDREAFTDLKQIEMVIVDGPPGGIRPQARYPALPMLLDRLADGAIILLANVDSMDQDKIVESWLNEVPHIEREPSDLGTCAILRYRSTPFG